MVISSDKKARFTVLSDCLVRMEQAVTAGTFEDRATLAVIDRQHQGQFKSGEAGGVLTITTSCVTVSYTIGSDFTADGGLKVSSADGKSPAFEWSAATNGLVSEDNLMGTIRSRESLI